ncbi:hypothetical protein KQI42_04705 [Tissierella sp. MSJ-40]|uniref:Zinc ribbon domain-containing protein n=1 Tax=Tissierella simiarum TaxID=2841534 RepID=A0ABS6E310_9FIRM|nr:hypothetical protein [Tissierella simiarum]MBU5437296.1 hypothetical protein [Tissierella simiarum]
MEINITSKHSLIINIIIGKISSIFGWILTLFFTMGLVAIALDDMANESFTLIFFLIFVIIGIWLIMFGIRRKKLIRRFKEYEQIISSENETSINNIANITFQSSDFVMDDIQTMINKKLFTNVFIDKNDKRIIFEKRNDSVKTTYDETASISIHKEMSVVKCSGCGAPNKIPKGSSSECEFCGSPIVSNERY